MATKSKKSTIAVDFSDTEAQGVLEEGDYLLEVAEVEKKTSDNSGNDYLSIELKVAEGPFKGKKVYHNCSLQPQALFNLRGVLEALGFDVPQGVMDLDVADMIGEQCGASVAHEVYNGKTKARPVEFFPAADLDSRGETAPAPTKVVKKSNKPEPEAKAPEPEAPAKRVKGKVKKALGVGDKVTFTDEEGDEQTGAITAVDDDTYTVVVGTGKKAEEWELSLEDLTAA